MTEATEQPADTRPAIVQRPAIVAGLVGAVIALSALAVWPEDYYLFVRQSLVAVAALLGLFALLGLSAVKDPPKGAFWVLVPIVIVGAFWLFTYGEFGREVNMIADVVTAAVFVIVGLAIRPQQKFATAGVTAWFIAAALLVAITTTNQISNRNEYEACLDEAAQYGEDPELYCDFSPPDD
ncbi:hypothetical protein [Agromyces bauzanensis]